MANLDQSGKRENRAIERIFSVAKKNTKELTEQGAKFLIYAATAATIAQIVGWDPTAIGLISPVLGKFVELVGANLLANMIDRVAERDDFGLDEIQEILKSELRETKLDYLLTEQKFVETINSLQNREDEKFQYLRHHLSSISAILNQQVHEQSNRSLYKEIKLVSKIPTSEIPRIGSLPPGSHMIFDPNPLFSGREGELRSLASIFRGSKNKNKTNVVDIGKVAVVSGIAGVGKTQLAVEFVYRYGRYFSGGVYWLSFADIETVPTQIVACGKGMNLGPLFDTSSIDEQIETVQREWSGPLPRLLIFDNLDQDDGEQLLAKFKPKGGGARLLVTSRRDNWDPTLGINNLFLQEMSRCDSINLLQKYQPNLGVNLAGEIALELGYLPLALDLAGGYLQLYDGVVQPDEYLEKLRENKLLKHPSLKGLSRQVSPTAHDLNVGRTFALSIQRLDKKNQVDKLALAILGRVACFAPGEPIPWEMLQISVRTAIPDEKTILVEIIKSLMKIKPMPDEEEVAESLARLRHLGLVQVTLNRSTVMHKLIAAFVMNAPITQGRGKSPQDAVEFTVMEFFRDAWVAEEQNSIKEWEGHFRHVTNGAIDRGSDWASSLSNHFAVYLNFKGDYRSAATYARATLSMHGTVHFVKDPIYALELHNLAHSLFEIGELHEAKELLEIALNHLQGKNNQERFLISKIQLLLGYILLRMGDVSAANHYFELTFSYGQHVFGTEHSFTLASMQGIGETYLETGQPEKASEYFHQILASLEDKYGKDNPETAHALANISRALSRMGRREEAKVFYERSLTLLEKSLGPDHPDLIPLGMNYGYLLYVMGSYPEAQIQFERAQKINQDTFGSTHPNTALCYAALCFLCLQGNDISGAHTYVAKAVHSLKNAKEIDHLNLVIALSSYGFILWKLNKHSEASARLREAYEGGKMLIDKSHPGRSFVFTILDSLLAQYEDISQARTFYLDMANSLSRTTGPNHPFTKEVQAHLKVGKDPLARN